MREASQQRERGQRSKSIFNAARLGSYYWKGERRNFGDGRRRKGKRRLGNAARKE